MQIEFGKIYEMVFGLKRHFWPQFICVGIFIEMSSFSWKCNKYIDRQSDIKWYKLPSRGNYVLVDSLNPSFKCSSRVIYFNKNKTVAQYSFDKFAV